MLACLEDFRRLLVPKLQQTLTKHLRSLIVLVDNSEYELNCNNVNEFGQAGGTGEKLTRTVEEGAKYTMVG